VNTNNKKDGLSGRRTDGGETSRGSRGHCRHGRYATLRRGFRGGAGADRMVEFCASIPGEMRHDPLGAARCRAVAKAFKDLVSVNRYVNESIKPMTDLEHWGTIEKWSYPDDGYGDCEDYVLLSGGLLVKRVGARRSPHHRRARPQGRGPRRAHGEDRPRRVHLDNQARGPAVV